MQKAEKFANKALETLKKDDKIFILKANDIKDLCKNDLEKLYKNLYASEVVWLYTIKNQKDPY